MRRQPLVVRDAGPEDATALVRLWAEAGNGGEHSPGLVDEAPQALAHLAADPDERLVVCEHDGEVVAALHLRRAPFSPIHLEQVVNTSFLMVLPDHRRHGYARALLDAAASWAEEKDINRVSALVPSGSRDANRFLARLGLGTIATARIVPTAVLRKKLSPAPLGHGGSRSIGQVLAARRSMRRRQAEATDPTDGTITGDPPD